MLYKTGTGGNGNMYRYSDVNRKGNGNYLILLEWKECCWTDLKLHTDLTVLSDVELSYIGRHRTTENITDYLRQRRDAFVSVCFWKAAYDLSRNFRMERPSKSTFCTGLCKQKAGQQYAVGYIVPQHGNSVHRQYRKRDHPRWRFGLSEIFLPGDIMHATGQCEWSMWMKKRCRNNSPDAGRFSNAFHRHIVILGTKFVLRSALQIPPYLRYEMFGSFLFTARSKLRKVLFLALSVTFCLGIKYLGNRWTDLCQIHRADMFSPSLGRVWMSRSEIKGQGHHGQTSSPLKMQRNALAANDVTQQQTGPFRRCRWVMGVHRRRGLHAVYVR